MSPIAKVPEDILRLFFEEAIRTSLHESTLASKIQLAFDVAATCRYWRQVILGSPRVWAFLVTPELWPPTLNAIISRAGDCHWSLFLGLLEGGPDVPFEILEKNYVLVFENIRRCRSIYVDATRLETMPAFQAFHAAIKERSSILQSLTLSIHSIPSSLKIMGDQFSLLSSHSHDSEHGLRALHLRGMHALNPSLSISNKLPHLTSLILQSSRLKYGVEPIIEGFDPAYRFTPKAFLDFLRPMTALRVLVLDSVVKWKEPSMYNIEDPSLREILDSQASSDPSTVAKLPNLAFLEIRGDIFGSSRLLESLKMPSTCVIKIRAFSRSPSTWRPGIVKRSLSTFFDLVPRVKDIPVWNFAFGRMLVIRAEKDGKIIYDLRVDLNDLVEGSSLASIHRALRETAPSALEELDFESAITLRLMLDPDEELGGFGGEDAGLWDFAESIFRRCISVTHLHLHGISIATYKAISQTSFMSRSSLCHALPRLTTIFVVASSFGSSHLYLSNWQYLANILHCRAEKGKAVSQLQTLVVVDDITGNDGEGILDEEVIPHTWPFRDLVHAWMRVMDYNRGDLGLKFEHCASCKRLGAWYGTSTSECWVLTTGDVVALKCICISGFAP